MRIELTIRCGESRAEISVSGDYDTCKQVIIESLQTMANLDSYERIQREKQIAEIDKRKKLPCSHERLNMEGICLQCGEDRRRG